MNAARASCLFVAFAGIALATIHLKSEQTRSAARVLEFESQWVALRREWWALQARAARLRVPVRLRDRVENLQTGLIAPEARPAHRPPAQLTAHLVQ